MPTLPQGTSSAAAPPETDLPGKTSAISASSSAKPASGGEPDSPQTNVKETIESILVAFILAFVFRAFVVEAFVIPTGSMAPTLYGAHMRLQCPDCGYTFDVGYSSRDRNDDTNIQSEARRPPVHCPNCNFLINSNDHQTVRFGDRILVQKYLYLFENPRRWDVVVFKSPDEAMDKHDSRDPEYGQNYIKRLVGLPGSSIVILDGDVYSGPFNANGPGDFHIERKSLSAQQALWRTVYDNDYIPHLDPSERDSPWRQPWQPVAGGKGWNLGDAVHSSRTFTFDQSDGDGAISYLPEDPRAHGLYDWLPYDVVDWQHFPRVGTGGSDPPQPVSDLKLSCFYRRDGGDGPFQLLLTKSEYCFMARVERGKISLVRARRVPGMSDEDLRIQDEKILQTVEVPALSGSDFAQVELQNVDYRVSVRVNGKIVIATTDAQYTPYIAELWDRAQGRARDPFPYPVVRIEAARQNCTVQHLLLSRDIYYLNSRSSSQFWASPDQIVHLNPGEYFVLGDNSLISGDARYWHTPVELPREGLPFVESGRVPERFMLGRAFFVYWPAGYRPGSWIPWAIIPDFGEMRFIH